MPPYSFYKGKNIYDNWCLMPFMQSRNQDGWTIFSMVQRSLVKYTDSLVGPKVLYLDGHLSHISIAVIKLALAKNIHIICLPAHSSHVFQPLDVSCL